MKLTNTFALLSSLLVAKTVVAADSDFPTVEVIGNKFFYTNNGSQFYMRGIAYQQNTAGLDHDAKYIDPLASDTCLRDIPYFKELNTNTLRIYALNATADHDECMHALQDAGIYVIADLSSPDESIITTDPEWTVELYDRYTSVVDMMQQYNNVLGFFAGNEVITNNTNTNVAPFVKAAVRDMKAYIKEKGYRNIPVGYSANDDADTRVASADYFACGDDDIKADFYGINMYEWCGRSSFKTSGYEDRTEEFSNLTIPVFFSEYGCNEVQPRPFTEVQAIFGPDMTDVWSGGIVYMYFEEENNYGLVSIEDGKVSTLPDFNNLKTEMEKISPTYATASDASKSAHSFACPPTGADWKAATALPPTPNEEICKCVHDSVSCAVSDDVDEEDFGDLFSVVCNYVNCDEINADGVKGQYGSFSFCSPKEKLNFVLNKYYEDQNKNRKACDFSGSATIVSASSASSCSALMKNASQTFTNERNSSSKTSSNESSKTSDSSSTVSSISSTSKAAGSTINAPLSSFKGLSTTYIITLMSSMIVGGISVVLM
ncbi:hypothetical protein CANINC_004538 [Pichia inconspicua]|uniref:1,3-beta-glucanosyltransferase n=1 Tax=Pichia inconspicua TaxID=52247 RepID=A0A4T0WVK4_9ASCO|nr:hypothetical protein CANINC_004538 [[Candida] inconspicua]